MLAGSQASSLPQSPIYPDSTQQHTSQAALLPAALFSCRQDVKAVGCFCTCAGLGQAPLCAQRINPLLCRGTALIKAPPMLIASCNGIMLARASLQADHLFQPMSQASQPPLPDTSASQPAPHSRPTLKLPAFQPLPRTTPLLDTQSGSRPGQSSPTRQKSSLLTLQPPTAPYRPPEPCQVSEDSPQDPQDPPHTDTGAAEAPSTAGKGPSLAALLLRRAPRAGPDVPETSTPSSPTRGRGPLLLRGYMWWSGRLL